VTTCGAYGNVAHDQAPVVSRDGSTLAWTRELPRGRDRVLVAAPDGSRPRSIDSPGGLAALSPDGQEALLVAEREAGDVTTSSYFLADTAAGKAQPVSENEATETRRRWRTPEWSPDGRFYVAEKDVREDFRIELWLMPAEGGPGRRLFRPAEPFSQVGWPAWSPDGKTIAFLARPKRGDEYATAVWVVRPDGSGARQITNTYDSFDLAWSPDGRRLLFAEYPWKEAARIGVVRPDGSGLRWLTRPHYASGGQSATSPAWLDNERVVFEARQWTYRSTANRVVVLQSVRLDGSGERRLTYHCHLGLRGRDRSYEASHLPDVVRTLGGDDLVYAGPGDDDVDPGAGADRVFAGPGRDLIRARDEERDRVDCGAGLDVALVDSGDRAVGCERISRRRK
jgi:Tol biopolymer transport system component